MVIDGAKGVEDRTIKLMGVCRLRDTPIISFVNKLDRPIRDPIELLDEIEEVLDIPAAPINWPIGMGDDLPRRLQPVHGYDPLFERGHNAELHPDTRIDGLDSDEARELLGEDYETFCEESSWCAAPATSSTSRPSSPASSRRCSSARRWPTSACARCSTTSSSGRRRRSRGMPRQRAVRPTEPDFSGFVFKIQANMDPRHRDRIAFLRVCSGRYEKGMKMRHARLGKDVRIADAVTFKAGERVLVEEALAGDIIGLHNHGTIQIGDTFTERRGPVLHGYPALRAGAVPPYPPARPDEVQAAAEGPAAAVGGGLHAGVRADLSSTDLIVGAVGQLQFDVVAYRLKDEYKVEAIYEPVNVYTARWVYCDDERKLEEFRKKAADQLSIDGGGHLSYLAPTRVNLSLMEERWPDIEFARRGSTDRATGCREGAVHGWT
jgi:peptide chain release factor 3